MTARANWVWTPERVRALGVATTLVTAASVLGIGRTMAYGLVAEDAFPVPVVRVGNRVIVPVAPLLRLLGLDGPAEPGRAGLDDAAGSSVHASTQPADSPPAPRVIHPEPTEKPHE